MISPYSKEGFVDNYTASGYSILAFIDYNWHLPYLNPIVKEFGPDSILYGLNFTAPRPPLVLTPENWSYPVPLQYPIHYGYVATINNNYSIYNAIYHDKQMGNYTPPQYFLEGNVVQGGVQKATGSSAGFPTLLLWIPVLLVIIAVGVLLERRK